jgi:AcrR family transcriptional regulator
MSKKSERPETRLLRVAKRRIAWGGVQGAEIRKLAELAGTSTSRFHEFYRKRDELLAKVFDDGWQQVQISIAERIAKQPPVGIEDFITAIIEGALDAFERYPDDVGAMIVLGLTTVGQPVRKRLRSTTGFAWYVKIAETLEREFKLRLPPEEVTVALEILFGAVIRKMLLLTPMYRKKHKLENTDREVFTRLMRRVALTLFEQSTFTTSVDINSGRSPEESDDRFSLDLEGPSEEEILADFEYGIY